MAAASSRITRSSLFQHTGELMVPDHTPSADTDEHIGSTREFGGQEHVLKSPDLALVIELVVQRALDVDIHVVIIR